MKREDIITISNEFYLIALHWVNLMEKISKKAVGLPEMKMILPILADLILHAMELPHDICKCRFKKKNKDYYRGNKEYKTVSFEEKYRYYDMYLLPYENQRVINEKNKETPCVCDLNDDINSITEDLLIGISAYEKGEYIAAAYLWGHLYKIHWGVFHASQAFYAMQHAYLENTWNRQGNR